MKKKLYRFGLCNNYRCEEGDYESFACHCTGRLEYAGWPRRYAVQLDTIQVAELPVIFLTVRGDSNDIVSGFRKGADDYVVKPFELGNSVFPHMCAAAQGRKRIRPISHLRSNLARPIRDDGFFGEEEISLSQPEYQVLLLRMRNKGKTITRERLLEQVWDCNGSFVNNNTLTVTIKRLREKLHQPLCLKTVRSFGYRMEDTL